jgi:hypothetical protein
VVIKIIVGQEETAFPLPKFDTIELRRIQQRHAPVMEVAVEKEKKRAGALPYIMRKNKNGV